MKFEFYRQIFRKYPNTDFHENPYSGSPVVLCGHTAGQREGRAACMTNLIFAFRSFTKAANNDHHLYNNRPRKKTEKLRPN